MIIHDATPQGALVAPNEDEKRKRWIWRDTIVRALTSVRSGAYADTAQLTTGIHADESDLTDLLAHMDGRAS